MRIVARTIALAGPIVYGRRFIYILESVKNDDIDREFVEIMRTNIATLDRSKVCFIFETQQHVYVKNYDINYIPVDSFCIEKRRFQRTPQRAQFETDLLDYILSLPPADMCVGHDIRKRDGAVEIVETSYGYVAALEGVVDVLIDD